MSKKLTATTEDGRTVKISYSGQMGVALLRCLAKGWTPGVDLRDYEVAALELQALQERAAEGRNGMCSECGVYYECPCSDPR